jgi:hypothetical protein
LFLGDDPVHAEIDGRDRAVGVLADDDEAHLGAQHVHRLGAVRRNAELLAGGHDASHTCRASLAQTLTSYASSPEKLIRITRAGTPAAVPSRAAMKGNASGEKSIPSHTDSTTLPLSGPTTAAVAQWSVTDVR